MVEWIIVWYLVGLVSSIAANRLLEWTVCWDIGTPVDPFTYRDLLMCAMFGVLGPIATFFLFIGTLVSGWMIGWKLFTKKFDLDRPVFAQKKKDTK